MIELKKYSNGTYSYYSERAKAHRNIPSELAEQIMELKEQVERWYDPGPQIKVINHKPSKI